VKGSVFISYRREDSAGFAGRIYDRLVSRLEADRVFFDVDNIEPGLDFVKVLADRVGHCDALVAIIGAEWLTSANDEHERRLDDPHDFVRVELETALQRDIRVIPVLVNGARMPRAADLPDSLKPLVRRQAIEISHMRFESDSERLTRVLQRALHDHAPSVTGPEPDADPIVAEAPPPAPVAEKQKQLKEFPAPIIRSKPGSRFAAGKIKYAAVAIMALIAILGIGVLVTGHRSAKPPVGSDYLARINPPLPVNFTDDLEKIRSAYHTAQAPAPEIDAATHKQDGTTLHLKEAGVDFGFTDAGKIKVIGLLAPFSGSVAGLKIGDTRATVEKLLGKPSDADSFGTVADYGPTLEIWYDTVSNQVTRFWIYPAH
jgi:hypothetical protein